MPKGKPTIPARRATAPQEPRGILELDRFNEATLSQWNSASRDLDELVAVLYFGLEPERRRLRPDLLAALQAIPLTTVELARWARVVTYQYSLEPLSSAGSLKNIGGRFNAGAELDANTLNPWPALYLAEDNETAFREKFQIPNGELTGGLTPQELALEHGVSHTNLFVKGHLSRVFDMTKLDSLAPVAKVLGRIKMPPRTRQIQARLKIASQGVFMVQTGKQLHEMVLKQNWRILPIQYGLPAQSQILAELIRAAGFEAILYQSTKGPGKCLAVFPDLLDGQSFVELVDKSPPAVKHVRLDIDTATELAGWDILPPQLRAR
ncbi:MAG: RES family NAD+ phosphorylase [Burkholderiaceae bacterium]